MRDRGRGPLYVTLGGLLTLIVVVVTADVAKQVAGGRSIAAPLRTRHVGAPVTLTPTTDPYDITYVVVVQGSRSQTRVQGRAPFDALTTGPAGPVLDTFGGIEVATAGSDAVIVTAPSVAGGGEVFSGDLAGALTAGLVVDRHASARVAGQTCRVVRTGRPLDFGLLARPTADDHADLCLDAAGHVLAEDWTRHGSLFRARRAVSMTVGSADLRPHPHRLPAGSGGGGVVRVASGVTLGDVPAYALAKPPAGFTAVGRYLVVADSTLEPSGDFAPRTVSLCDVYRRGPDLVTVENLVRTDDVDVLDPHAGVAGPDGSRLLRYAISTEVRRVTGHTAVRVFGTLSSEALETLFAALVPDPGTQRPPNWTKLPDVITGPEP